MNLVFLSQRFKLQVVRGGPFRLYRLDTLDP